MFKYAISVLAVFAVVGVLFAQKGSANGARPRVAPNQAKCCDGGVRPNQGKPDVAVLTGKVPEESAKATKIQGIEDKKFKVFVVGKGYSFFCCEFMAAEAREAWIVKGFKVGEVQKVTSKTASAKPIKAM